MVEDLRTEQMTNLPLHEPASDLTSHVLSVLGAILESSGEDSGLRDIGSELPFAVPPIHAKRAQSLLVTLHFMYPHELLPALDLLDRKLISCHNSLYSTESQCPMSGIPSGERGVLGDITVENTKIETFYIKSASAAIEETVLPFHHRQAHAQIEFYYEVRLDSWNCTCPAFAYASTSSSLDSPDHTKQVDDERPIDKEDVEGCSAISFGGSSTTSSDVPMCKHMLAVAMWKAAPSAFGDSVNMHYTNIATTAGWAAGWGHHS